MQLPKALQLVQRQVIARQVQQTVQQHRAVTVAQYKTVTIRPKRVRRIVLQRVVPQHLGNVGHAHRRAGMARVGLLNRVHRKRAEGIGKGKTLGHGSGTGFIKGPLG